MDHPAAEDLRGMRLALGALQGSRPATQITFQAVQTTNRVPSRKAPSPHGWRQLAPTCPRQVFAKFLERKGHLPVELSQRQTFTSSSCSYY